ncbi:MAG: hypothetical protein EXS63_05820, partial [Candidatus Omnitrophica bacterium]|nr:hypothetical protein [Candidatus Omnitrophota bacterium]
MTFNPARIFLTKTISCALVFSLSWHPLYAQDAAVSSLAQDIASFEAAKKQWEDQRQKDSFLLDQKEGQLEHIKQELLEKIQNFKKEKEGWDTESRSRVTSLERRGQEMTAEADEKIRSQALALQQERAHLAQVRRSIDQERKAFDENIRKEKTIIPSVPAPASVDRSKELLLQKEIASLRGQVTKSGDIWAQKENQLKGRVDKLTNDLTQREQKISAIQQVLAEMKENLKEAQVVKTNRLIAQETESLSREQALGDFQKQLELQKDEIARKTAELARERRFLAVERAGQKKVLSVNSWEGKEKDLARREAELQNQTKLQKDAISRETARLAHERQTLESSRAAQEKMLAVNPWEGKEKDLARREAELQNQTIFQQDAISRETARLAHERQTLESSRAAQEKMLAVNPWEGKEKDLARRE